MASSPTSTASSSDLYAASESIEDHILDPSIESGLQADQGTTLTNGVEDATVDVTPQTETMSEDGDRQSLQGQITERPDKRLANGHYKRKRDEDWQTSNAVEAESRSPGPMLPEYHSSDNHQPRPEVDARPSSETFLVSKRIKTNGHSATGSGPTNAGARTGPLPAELWHHVFRFVPPVFLGHLLRVNRAFHSYLTFSPQGPKPVEGLPHKGVQPLEPEAIWAASRKRFAAGVPRPLRGLHELDMWRLLRGKSCQLCGIRKSSGALPGNENPWEAGPGDQSMRVIWSFGVRCCGPCLEKSSEKEVDLLLSSACPSFLLPALPFAFVSNSLNYIPNTLLRESAAPPSLQIVKRFYKPHVQQIKQKLDNVRELGAASAEEWGKGLAEEGKERINDAIRWEQWEAKGGLRKVNMPPQAKVIAPALNTSTMQDVQKPYQNTDLNSSTSQRGLLTERYDDLPSNSRTIPANPQLYSQNPPPYNVPWSNSVHFNDPSLRHIPAPVVPVRAERTIKDVNEAKAARRAEIERRCSLFDPPLLPHILSHMESFQAAIQISTHLTDAAWDVLRPRLLNQRAKAERREQEQVQQNELLQSEIKQRHYQEPQSNQSKETVDRHWDSFQAPLRDKLGVLADVAINERWSGGAALTKENSPQFAADVLLHARQLFHDEVARAQRAPSISGQPVNNEQPNGPPTQTLTLENMKWLFDTKIKPFTENLQRELFLCNGCDDNFKFYGFEGVIQHYAAKHTSSLSMGSVVVYWRAEWPEEPPFNPHPNLSKSASYKVPSPATVGPNNWSSIEQQLYDPAGRSGVTSEAEMMQTMDGTPAYTHASYHEGQTVPYSNTSYQPPYYQAYTSAHQTWYPNRSIYSSPNGQLPQWQASDIVAPPTQNVGGQDFGPHYIGHNDPGSLKQQGTASVVVRGTQPVSRVAPSRPPHFDPSRNNAAQLTEGYQQQMDEMAKQARDVWQNTSNIRDLPASVRIHVVIHHIAARFSAKFLAVPSLALFLDGLDNNAQMRPVRSLNGLACKTCVTQHNKPFLSDPQSQPPANDRRLYTLPHLLNHFRTAHLEGPQAFANPNSGPDGPRHDWTRDMIELPEDRVIAGLVHSAGMDDNKLELIAWAFPHLFPSPLPRLSTLRTSATISHYKEMSSGSNFKDDYLESLTHHALNNTSPSMENRAHNSSYNQTQIAPRPMSRVSQPSEPPGEDEYDPHKPAYRGIPSMTGASRERTEGRFRVSPDPAGAKFERHERAPDRQVPDTTDLSKLIYGATHMRSFHQTPNYQINQQPHQPAKSTSSVFVKPEPDESAGIRGLVDYGRMVDDDKYRNGQLTEYYKPGEVGTTSRRSNEQSPSTSTGVQAAEQFLQHLGQTSGHGRPENYQQYSQRSPVNSWPDGRHTEVDEGIQYPSKAFDYTSHRTAPKTHEMSPDNPIYTNRPASQDALKTQVSHPRASQVYDRSNIQRVASNAMIRDGDLRMNGRGSHIYSEYSTPYRNIVEDHDIQNSENIERPDGSRDTFRITQAPYDQDRQRASASVAAGTRFYGSNNPVEEDLPQSMYRIRSPVTRKEHRAFYEYPRQDRYEIEEEHQHILNNQNRYAQRIEYVPVRMGNQGTSDMGRYIIAQPMDSRGRADYVRLEEPYGQEAVFERDGQLYRTESRAHQTPLIRGSTGTGPNYSY